MSLCAAFFALGLLVYGLGRNLDLFPLAAAGLADAAVAGPLLLLHGVFHLRRRKSAPPAEPRIRLHPVAAAPPRSAGCCGRWS
jgi:hypothetical protein